MAAAPGAASVRVGRLCHGDGGRDGGERRRSVLTRLMGEDEATTLRTLEEYKGVMSELIRALVRCRSAMTVPRDVGRTRQAEGIHANR